MITTKDIQEQLLKGFNFTNLVIEKQDYNKVVNLANSLGYYVTKNQQFSYKGSQNENYRVLDCRKVNTSKGVK
jgi:hypothetical protein